MPGPWDQFPLHKPGASGWDQFPLAQKAQDAPPLGATASNAGAGRYDLLANTAGAPADIAADVLGQLGALQWQLNVALPPQMRQYAQHPSFPIENPIGGAESIKAALGTLGGVLPASRNAQGNPQFDSNAGLLGMTKRAVSLPGDVASGQTPILNQSSDSDGAYNPDLIRRSVDLAGLMSPVNPAMRAGDSAIPGVLGAQTERQPVAPPTALQLKKVGGRQFDEARASGMEIRADSVAQLARDIQQGLHSGFDGQPGIGATPESATKTFAMLDRLANPPKGDFETLLTVPNIQSVQRGFSGLSGEGGTEGLAAGITARRIGDYLSAIGPDDITATSGASVSPESVANTLRTANQNYAASHRSNDLTGTLDRATTGILEKAEGRAQASNSGRNIGNTIRQKVESFLEKPKEVYGFSDDEIAALRNVVNGDPLRNSSRYLGNLLGGGGGLGAAVTAGGAAGLMSHDPITGMLSAGLPIALGHGAKSLDNFLTKRSLSSADDLVRTRSPLYQEMQAQAPTFVPGLDRDALIARIMGLGTASNFPIWGQMAPPVEAKPRRR